MLYQRGKQKTWWYRFRFGGRIVHESAKTQSKTVAREAERQRRRELEETWNRIEKRALPPTLEKAGSEWSAERVGRVSALTVDADVRALKHLNRVLGARLLCDIDAQEIARYQRKRLLEGLGGRTVNMELEVLRQILKAHRLWNAIAPDVHMLPERKDIGRALTADQEHRLLEETAKTEDADSPCHTATLLALNTTMGRRKSACSHGARSILPSELSRWASRKIGFGRAGQFP